MNAMHMETHCFNAHTLYGVYRRPIQRPMNIILAVMYIYLASVRSHDNTGHKVCTFLLAPHIVLALKEKCPRQ